MLVYRFQSNDCAPNTGAALRAQLTGRLTTNQQRFGFLYYRAVTVGTSATLVVQDGNCISERRFHSRLKPCDAVTFVHFPNRPLISSNAPISRARLSASSSNSVRGRMSAATRSSSMIPALV